MDDLISRRVAIDALMEQFKRNPTIAIRAKLTVEGLPSAQSEIIRCKDCKWWSNDDYRECSSPNYDDGYVTPAGFYCGYAERRTDDGE